MMLIREMSAKVKQKESPVLWLLKTGLAVRMVPLVREGVGDVAHNRNLLV